MNLDFVCRMQTRRQSCSSVCLLLYLGLLWPSAGCRASLQRPRHILAASSGSLWQQAWPPESSSRDLGATGNTAPSGRAQDGSLQPRLPAQPADALNGSQVEAPQQSRARAKDRRRIPGLFGASFHAGSREATPPAPALHASSRGPATLTRVVHRRSLAQAPPSGFLVGDADVLAPAPAPDQAAYLLVVMEVRSLTVLSTDHSLVCGQDAEAGTFWMSHRQAHRPEMMVSGYTACACP